MATKVDVGAKTRPSSAALAIHRRVKNSSGKWAYAGASDSNAEGVTTSACFAADVPLGVDLWNKPGTVIMTASEAITDGATLYAAANGKVAATGTVKAGIAQEAATADGDFIEVLPFGVPQDGLMPRSQLIEEENQSHQVPLTSLKVWDARVTNLPGTAGNDDLALITGTFLTDAPQVEGADFGGTSDTKKAGFEIVVPHEYEAGSAAKIRVRAKMKVIADTSATIDLQVARRAAPTVDIVADAAQSINSATAADKDFDLTPDDLVPGDVLIGVITFAGVDAGNAAANITAVIEEIEALFATKG